MIHELLIGLAGFSGPILRITSSNQLEFAENQLPFLHESEKVQIQQICEIASLHYQLAHILKKDEKSLDLYEIALRNAIRTLLEPYKQLIAKYSMNNSSFLSLSALLSEVKLYKVLFHKLLELLQAKNTILTLFPSVYHLASSGNPMINEAGLVMCKYMNRVTLFQIQKFLIGETQSPLFWIHKNPNSTNWSSEYQLVPEQIPPPLTVPICRKFLFIASTCHLLKRQSDANEKLEVNSMMTQWYVQLQVLSKQNVPGSFAQQLELVITRMYNQITVHLWKMIYESDVKNLFRDLRQLYLLDGDIFPIWLANGALKTLQTNTSLFFDAVGDLNRQYQRMERQFDCFDEVVVLSDATTNQLSNSSYIHPYEQLFDQISRMRQQWHDSIRLNIQIKWPLCILVSDEILEIYNQIWQFLLLVKRIQMELNDCYMTILKQKNSDNKMQQRVHMVMNFIVDHIWYFLGVDVIDSQFSQFEQFLRKCESYQACRVQHEQLLMKIHKSMFLGKSGQVVKSTLVKLLDIILVYAHCIRTEQIDLYIQDIELQWNRQTSLFWNLLENGADREVSVLCLRVDYNGWFSGRR